MNYAVVYTKQAQTELLRFPDKIQRQLATKISRLQHGFTGDIKNCRPRTTFIVFGRGISGFCLKSKDQPLLFVPSVIERKPMNKPALKETLSQIQRQRGALAKVRAEAEDLEDYLAVLEARARDTGERLPMAAVHRRVAGARRSGAVAVK